MTMNQTIGELLRQGLAITAVGMSLVFGALALLWGVIVLLGRIFRPEAHEPTEHARIRVTPAPEMLADPVQAKATAERARVAAIVAGVLLANAVPLHLEPPAGPTFEHGRTAPAWVTTHRARIMRPWQPPRSSKE
jgi:Na+-transporting methylmalonyl-CoA/oxaloacetate decarboxylase gamma subunit